MKKYIAVLLTICMTVLVALVPDRFAYALGDTTGIVKTRGQTGDLSDIPPDEGEEIIGTDALTVAEKESIINSVTLVPLTTGYAPLDSVVQEIFTEILTDDMSTFEKVCAIYAYLMEGRVYDGDMPYVDWLYYNIHNTINYKSDYDRNRVCEAYGFLTRDEHATNKGICQHYNSAFVIMTRAIGLDTYVVDCTATSGTAISSHECSVLCANDTYYLFDPVMGVFLGNSEVETSAYFCTPLEYHPQREYCDMNEMINSFGYFETKTGGKPATVEEIPGATEGEFHFAFGSYPQTQVTDAELIAALNGLLNVNNMLSYGYYSGNGTIGSQTQSDYMRYADVEYEGAKYRAVRFSAYRPTYSYMPSEEGRSYQDDYGFSVNETYWFRFDPIEWRLVDGGLDNGSLLLADLALDAQPFNYAIYASETAKTIEGKEYYIFKDAACTQPVNDWNTSDIRAWLNDDFLNTAFTDEEKALIANSTLHNYGAHGYYDCSDTVDQVFLLSLNEVTNESYFLGASNSARILQGTDYARSQGLGVDIASQNSPCSWILRSAGDHSSDIVFVNAKGKTRFHMKAASEMCGIRPALRVSDLSALIPDSPVAPDSIAAGSTETGALKLHATACNGASSYNFYIYAGDAEEPVVIITSVNPTVIVSDLIPGQTYRICATAIMMIGGQETESPASDSITVLCRAYLNPPASVQAVASATRAITLSWTPVTGAVLYRVYRYNNAQELILCGETSDTTLTVGDLPIGYDYYFKVSCISADGRESNPSSSVSCKSESLPPVPENLTFATVSNGTIRVSWDASQGAARYHVERYIGDGYTEIGVTTDTEYSVTGLSGGVKYYFRVIAENEDRTSQSTPVSGSALCRKILPPDNIAVQLSGDKELTVSWNASDGATKYDVYRYPDSENAYAYIGSTSNLSYKDSDGLTIGKTYYYKVVAIDEGTGYRLESEKSGYASAKVYGSPDVPVGVTAVSNAANTVTISWTKATNAASYKVYRYRGTDKTYIEIGNTTGTSYDATGLSGGTTYYFKVAAVAEGGGMTFTGKQSASVNAKVISNPAQVTGLTVEAKGDRKLTLSWSASARATEYDVYRYQGSTNTYVYKATTSNRTYVDKDNLSVGTTYYYRVVAVNEGTNYRLEAPRSASACAKVIGAPDAPGGVTAVSKAANTVTVSWTRVKNATSYNVYRYRGTDKTYILVGSTTGTSYDVTGLSAGTTYYFKVAAVAEGGGMTFTGSKSVSVSAKVISNPVQVTGLTVKATADRKLTLSWSASAGATEYDVYRYQGSTNTYVYKATTSNRSYVDSDNLAVGTTYYYRVVAVNKGTGYRLEAPRSASASAKVLGKPAAPTGVTAVSNSKNTATVKWSAVKTATKYNVYRYRGSDKTYILVGSTTGTSYTVTGLSSGTTYYFKVEAVSEEGGMTFTGSRSASVNTTVQ